MENLPAPTITLRTLLQFNDLFALENIEVDVEHMIAQAAAALVANRADLHRLAELENTPEVEDLRERMVALVVQCEIRRAGLNSLLFDVRAAQARCLGEMER